MLPSFGFEVVKGVVGATKFRVVLHATARVIIHARSSGRAKLSLVCGCAGICAIVDAEKSILSLYFLSPAALLVIFGQKIWRFSAGSVPMNENQVSPSRHEMAEV